MEGDNFSTDTAVLTSFKQKNNEVFPGISNIENGQHGGIPVPIDHIDKMAYFTYSVKPEITFNNVIYNGSNGLLPAEFQGQDMINEPKLDFLQPKKPKNPDYVIAGDNLSDTSVTVKWGKPVRIYCEMPPSYKCKISLRYEDLLSTDKPVNVCNTHKTDVNIKAVPNTMFTVKGHNDVEYQVDDGHTYCILKSQGEYIIQFFCWNSCDIHRKNNKDIIICVNFYDNNSGLASKTKKVKLRVAENVKRDSGDKEKTNGTKKRDHSNMLQEFSESKIVSKKEKLSIDESDDPSPISPETEAPTLICIQVYKKSQVEMYRLMADELGNSLALIPGASISDENIADNIENVFQ